MYTAHTHTPFSWIALRLIIFILYLLLSQTIIERSLDNLVLEGGERLRGVVQGGGAEAVGGE